MSGLNMKDRTTRLDQDSLEPHSPASAWTTRRLDELITLEYGASLPERQRESGPIPVVGSAGIVGSHGECVVPGPGIVVGRKGSIGRVSWIDKDFFPIDTTYYVVPNQDHTDLRWAFHFLDHENLKRLNRATGVPGLNRDDVYAIKRAFPPLPEQRAIARILDSIDEAIERTEAVIEATKTLRKGLLNDLLTRGIPGRHTRFKQVPGLGSVPADWEVVQLTTPIAEFRYGTSMRSTYDSTGLPVLRIPNVVRGYIDTTDLKFATLPDSEMKLTLLMDNDVLFVRTNGNPDLCGRCSLVHSLSGDWLFASYLIRARVDQSVLEPEFLWLFSHSEGGRKQLRRHIRTSAGNYNLSVEGLSSIHIPLPTIREQKDILRLSRSFASQLDRYISELDALRTLKASIAGALLTGRVRVPQSMLQEQE